MAARDKQAWPVREMATRITPSTTRRVGRYMSERDADKTHQLVVEELLD